jgi:hypothetical protein
MLLRGLKTCYYDALRHTTMRTEGGGHERPLHEAVRHATMRPQDNTMRTEGGGDERHTHTHTHTPLADPTWPIPMVLGPAL